MSVPDSLDSVLDNLDPSASDDQVMLRELLDGYGSRAYGPMLLIPAFIAVAPTGAIPGMSLLTGSLIAIVALQMIMQRQTPWIPERLGRYAFSRKRLATAVERAKPYAQWLDGFLKPRLEFLTERWGATVIGIVSILLALSMFPLALLPFAVVLPGTAVALLGIGMTTRDGIVILAGLAIALAVFAIPVVWVA
ncbi:MAG: exopolysaccharide biosynthesis protein [Pseudomonadota bacterium]